LVADDDEFFRMALRTILTANLEFREVIETSSLDDALRALAERSEISLALFDLDMPGMRSAASLRAVRECFPDLRMAVVSGSGKRRDILAALAAGVHGYVPKSLGAGELSRALRLIVDGMIYVPSSISIVGIDDDEPGDLLSKLSSDQLSPRQKQVLELLVQGKSNKEIARALQLSEGTVKVHMAALFRVLGVTTRAAAAVAGSELLTRSM
jgi:DNA-binding NarL/FixJ family response regulator